MDMTSDILLSTRELGCRRNNQQSQRYLGCVLRQLDMERKLVGQDWDHRMKTFISQKKKTMPDGWDPGKTRRARSAWGEKQKHKFYVVSRPESEAIQSPFASKIPDHWNLCASYKILPSGERIPQPLPEDQNSALDENSAKTKRQQHYIHPSSARPPGYRKTRSVKSRRAVSAPVRRTGLSTCLITQNGPDRQKLDQLIEATNLDPKITNNVNTNYNKDNDPDSIAVNTCKPPYGYSIRNRPISAVVKRAQDRTSVNSRPKSGLPIGNRPVSAVTNGNRLQHGGSSSSLVRNKDARSHFSSKRSLSSGSLSSIDDSAGSYSLLKRITNLD